MWEQFVPFNLALKLKDLGCDVKTISYYDMEGSFYPMGNVMTPTKLYFGAFIPKYQYKEDLEPLVSAPLWQQAFDWFREEHGLHINFVLISETLIGEGGYMLMMDEMKPHRAINDYTQYPTYEKAREEGLYKLIEIVKNRLNKN